MADDGASRLEHHRNVGAAQFRQHGGRVLLRRNDRPSFIGDAQASTKIDVLQRNPLVAKLQGEVEVPPGDLDGTGTFTLFVNPGQKRVCYELTLAGIDTPTAAHIHKAPPTEAGPVVAPLTAPAADGKSSACVTVAEDLAKDILQNPDAYYVNVHNAEFPAGAVRGQLAK